ncbi:MAG: hypothetical protein HYX92_03535 [Chloroflexi bacterium]|nr:hypothetical protein [Chloroflexota bacterium]
MDLGPWAPRALISVRSATAVGLVVALLAAGSLVMPGTPAFADPPAPTPKQTEKLERRLQVELKVLERGQKALARAGKRADRVQQLIDRAKAAGKDVTNLEAALFEFKADVATARSHYDQAKSILDVRAGFDADGKVTNVDQARETVRAAAREERQFLRTMRKATRDLGKAIKESRQANRAASLR